MTITDASGCEKNAASHRLSWLHRTPSTSVQGHQTRLVISRGFLDLSELHRMLLLGRPVTSPDMSDRCSDNALSSDTWGPLLNILLYRLAHSRTPSLAYACPYNVSHPNPNPSLLAVYASATAAPPCRRARHSSPHTSQATCHARLFACLLAAAPLLMHSTPRATMPAHCWFAAVPPSPVPSIAGISFL